MKMRRNIKRSVTANRNSKKSVKAAYGGWGKFYGLNDVEFTVPNDTDDPTIYYNGKYYNYYDIEDTLWSYYKEECAENGVAADENEFENWVADNSYLVYDLLDEVQPKSEPGRGVYREESGYLRSSVSAGQSAVMAIEDDESDPFIDALWVACDDVPGLIEINYEATEGIIFIYDYTTRDYEAREAQLISELEKAGYSAEYLANNGSNVIVLDVK